MAPSKEIPEPKMVNTRIPENSVQSNSQVPKSTIMTAGDLPPAYSINPPAYSINIRRRTSVHCIYDVKELNGCEYPVKNIFACNSDLPKDDKQMGLSNKYISQNDAEMENIFNTLGFGRWNTWFILLICLCQSAAPTQYYNPVFTNMPTKFRCEDNLAVNEQNKSFDNSCGEPELVSIHNVSVHKTNNQTILSSNSYDKTCLKYVYDNSLFTSTFSKEFHLVCDKAWISNLFQLIFVLGSIFGNLFTGLSDKYGRACVIKVSSYFFVLGVLNVGFGFNAYIVLFGRFLTGFCYPILNNAAYTLAIETTPTRYRSTVGIMVFAPFDLCTILLGLFAYYIREWRLLYLLISFPIYPLPLVAMFISESPRWLIQQGYFEEAYSVLKYASIKNGKIIASKQIVIQAMQNSNSKSSSEKTLGDKTNRIGIVGTLFASSKMTKISIITPLLWFLMSIIYCGIPLNANNFTVNPFLYIAMQGCLQLPMDTCGHFVITKFGNIKSAQISLFITGLCMFIMVGIPEQIIWPQYICVGIAMILISLVCSICFILSNELFPTVNRSVGTGMCSIAFYLGFFFGSLISHYLVDDISWGFNVVCGLCSIAAGLLGIILPETQGKPLCETVNDVDNRT